MIKQNGVSYEKKFSKIDKRKRDKILISLCYFKPKKQRKKKKRIIFTDFTYVIAYDRTIIVGRRFRHHYFFQSFFIRIYKRRRIVLHGLDLMRIESRGWISSWVRLELMVSVCFHFFVIVWFFFSKNFEAGLGE